jgi:DNA-directed RNA polymerase II subunit RPB2
LFIVENNNLKIRKNDLEKMRMEDDREPQMTFDNTVENGLIEFLDVEEEEVSMIAMMIDDLKNRSDYCYTYTHCEIHPSMILGVCASIIPFPDHNQVIKFLLKFI